MYSNPIDVTALMGSANDAELDIFGRVVGTVPSTLYDIVHLINATAYRFTLARTIDQQLIYHQELWELEEQLAWIELVSASTPTTTKH